MLFSRVPRRNLLVVSRNVVFAGGVDYGYFDCQSGGRGFESRSEINLR